MRVERNAATATAPVFNATRNVTQLFHQRRVFVLKKPINLKVSRVDRGRRILASYSPLNIDGYGEDLEAALGLFVDNFAAIWDVIASEAEQRLTPDAQRLKRKMRELVAEVKQL